VVDLPLQRPRGALKRGALRGVRTRSRQVLVGSKRPHTAESACRFLGVYHPTVDQAEPGRPMDAPAYEITSPALSSKDAGPINRL
jgi:hypothetical protein